MPIRGVLVDLLMATMNSLDAWATAAGDRERGIRWRDEVTARMTAADRYEPYEDLVAGAAADLGLAADAPAALLREWPAMRPWPDAAALDGLPVPWAFVTNCSTRLARMAAGASGVRRHRFVLSAEEAGHFKPHQDVYRAACRRLGTEPGETRFIAGSPYDAQGAHDAGLEAWFIARRPDHQLANGRIRQAGSFEELVRATTT